MPRMPSDLFSRGVIVGAYMASGGVLTAKYLREQFGVSRAQASRYMLAVETELRATATISENNRVELRLERN